MQALSELVAQMKTGGIRSDRIKVGGGEPQLLTTFFQKVLSSLSNDVLPHSDTVEEIGSGTGGTPEFIGNRDEKRTIGKVEYGKWADQPNEFRRMIQKHMSEIPPQYQLDELNRIQKDLPFGLVDPSQPAKSGGSKVKSGKRLTPKKVHYGYADLYKFLGFPYSDTPVRSSMQGQNPFYQPLELPVPDVYANNVLSHIRRFSPEQKLMAAKEIYDDIVKKSGGAVLIDSKTLDESYYKKIERMAELAHDVANRVYSPVTLSHFVAGQERPMKSYLEKDNYHNFNDMLWQLQKVHLIKSINPAPNVTNYKISESAMKQVMAGRGGKQQRRVVKKRAKRVATTSRK